MTSQPIRVTIDLQPEVRPLTGWLRMGRGPRIGFQGMVELLSLLDRLRRPDGPETRPGSPTTVR